MNNFEQLTKRQKFILEIIAKLGTAGNQEIVDKVSENFDKTSRVTIIRDLNQLTKTGFILRSGKGRGVKYAPKGGVLGMHIDSDTYFKKNPDERSIQKKKLDFGDEKSFECLFSQKILKKIEDESKKYQERLSSYSKTQIKKELERITIEFSWKSSLIEGNTYTLLDTERLIKEHAEAKGKTHEEAVMILNHKTALEYVWAHSEDFKTLSLKKIEEIHSLLSANLGISKGLRKRPVGIVGTAYKPFDNVYQLTEALEDLCKLINKIENPFVKAIVAVAGISYIQPFEDGNKRTSRLLGNAILLANNYCLLSYRSVDEIEYKKAIILFYERHSLEMFSRLFVEQYEFAVKNYFL